MVEDGEEEYRQLPRGVPTLTYARLLDPLPLSSLSSENNDKVSDKDDLEVDGDFVVVKEQGSALMRFPVAHVFPRGLSDQDFCECTIGQEAGAEMGASLNPIAACVEDATSAVIMLVGSKLTKKWQFLKRIFLPFVANELFACLSDKKNQGAEVYEYEITLKAFELQDEVITDLLRPTTRGLSISVAPESGVVIQGLQKERITSENHLRQLFIDSCDNRSSHTLPLGASIDTSSTVWEVTLHQKEGDSEVVLQNLSRLLVVDTPAVNPLCMTPSDVKVLDGPNLHKSLFSFADVTRKLASPQLAALAPFRSSKLTHFLGELLGGNSLVLGLGLLHPGEPSVSKKTLEVLANLTAARHYPISGKEMSEIVQGLMMKYRSMLLHMEDEMNAAKYKLHDQDSGVDSNGERRNDPEQAKVNLQNEILNSDHVKRLESQIVELQKSLVETKLLCEEKGADAAQIYEVLELLKAKYKTLLSEQSVQNEKMISIEREKLEVAKALVELKLEHGRVLEEAEKEKFELTSTVLALKTQSAENDDEIQVMKLELRDTNDKLAESQKWYDKEKEKAVSYHSQLEEVRGQLEKVEARNVEISTELVNLLNIRDTLERDLSVSQKQISDMEKVLDTDGNDLLVLRSKNAELEKLLQENEQSKDALTSEISHLKLEMERMTLEVERSKLDFEKSATQYLKDKDRVLEKEGNVARSEIQQLQYEKDQMHVTVRREERLKRDALRNLERVQEEYSELKLKLEDSKAECSALRDAYRNHLTDVLKGVEKDLTERDGKKPTFAGVAQGINAAIEMNPNVSKEKLDSIPVSRPGTDSSEYNPASWEAMIESFIANEKKLYSENDTLYRRNEQLVVAFRELFNHYRGCLNIIEDVSPQHLPADVFSSEAALLLQGRKKGRESESNNSKSKESNSLDNLTVDDIHNLMQDLQARLKSTEDALLAEQVKSADTCNSYRKSLQRTEKKLAESREENRFLKERIDVISSTSIVSNDASEEVQKLRLLQSQKQADEQKLKDLEKEAEFAKQREEYEKKHDAQMAAMYEKLEKQLMELKSASNGRGAEAELRKQLLVMKQQAETLKQENTQMRSALLQMPQKGVGGHDNVNAKIAALEKYIEKLEQNADKGLLYQMREVEKRSSELLSRNAGLEQELSSYKVYMRDALHQHKKQLKALKDQLRHYHLENNVPNNRNAIKTDDARKPEMEVDASQELLEKYKQIQQQRTQGDATSHPLLTDNERGNERRKQSVASGSQRSQSAGSQLPGSSKKNDVFFPKI